MAYQQIPIRPSSNILAISWDAETKDLQVVFVRNSRTYVFHGVDARTAESASRAESVGRWFNQEIKDLFPFEEL